MASSTIKSSLVTDYGFKSSLATDQGLSEHVKIMPSTSMVFPSNQEKAPRTERKVNVVFSSAKETPQGEILPHAAASLYEDAGSLENAA